MLTIRHIFILFIVLSMSLATHAQGYKGDKLKIDLKNPGQTAVLDISWIAGNIKILGYDGHTIIIDAVPIINVEEKDDPSITLKGMKQTLGSSTEVHIEEKGNTISIHSYKVKSTIQLTVRVPKNCIVKVKNLKKADIDVENISGILDISTSEGTIELSNIAGAALAHTMKGEIKATFARVDTENPTALSTMIGKIEVWIPANTKSNVKLKSEAGVITSDFTIKNDSEFSNLKSKGWINGKINGGGSELTLNNFQGAISLKKKK